MASLFGPIIHAGMVEDAAAATLKLWLPTYLREIERQHDRAQLALPDPKSWLVYSQADRPEDWPEAGLPAILLMCPGLKAAPEREGAGTYRARWDLQAGAVVSASRPSQTRQLAQLYGAAIRAAILQRPSLGGFAQAVTWTDEANGDMSPVDSRSLGYTSVAFTVDVTDAVDAMGGPILPDAAAHPDSPEWPDVTLADATVTLAGAPATTLDPAAETDAADPLDVTP